MSHSRVFASLLATIFILAATVVHAQVGIMPIPDQNIPSGKTLVVPIVATDPAGPARTYTVSVGPPTSGSMAGIMATIRTGDPHLTIGVSYTDSNSVMQTGTMDFQLLREFAPITADIIAGLAQGGFYSPKTTGTGANATTKYITFHRVVPGFVIQGGDPNGNGTGGPGFTFPNEFSSALIFSGTAGQLAMANSGNGASSGRNGTNGSQFFVTLSSDRADLDYTYNIFGQMLRGFDTLNGIAGTPVVTNTATNEVSLPANPVDFTSVAVTQNSTDAVLVLSATGVCDSVVTVTASSSAGSSVQTFTAHAVADTNDDPPFLLPVPETTAPNGNVNVPLQAVDLQLDLLRYGYERVLPVTDGTVTSGTTNVVTVPLISNTDNSVAAAVDHWNPTRRGYDERIFHVGAGDKPLRGSLTPLVAGRNGSLDLSPYAVAAFTSGNPKDTAASFSASVNWGDGTYLSGSDLQIIKDGARFHLMAGHDYTQAGEYPVIVKIADTGGARLLLTGTENISSSNIAISGMDLNVKRGILKNQILATFDDNGAASTAADYSATINWGDGSVSAGIVDKGPSSSYRILGSHVFKAPAAYTVSTVVMRSGSATYSGAEWSTAHVTSVTAPLFFPPFPQAHLAQIWSALYSDSNSIVTTGSTGGNPYAGLVQGTDGNFYGTTETGGTSGAGTVFQLTGSGSLTTLHSFADTTDGGHPYAELVQGSDENFYGTTETGGTGGAGTVYQITSSGSLTTLVSFTGGADGGNPVAGLIQGGSGDFYGSTVTGGTSNEGSIFQVTSSGSLTTIYSFSALSSGTNPDGANPYGTLLQANDNNLYGTTETGGTNGDGTLFQITASGTLNTLYSFSGSGDGANPFGALVEGTNGNLYGTTEAGGSSGAGTVFEITTSGSLTSLYSFTGGGDGGNPIAGLVQGTDGNFYGVTLNGGSDGSGTVFQITPSGSLTTLYSFTLGSSGRNPRGQLVQSTDGNFYGTTINGGGSGTGTVFEISSGGALNTLYSFSAGDTFQICVRGSVAIINSGNLRSAAGSLAVYADPNGTDDSEKTAFNSNGQSSFSIPPLDPGQYVIIGFRLEGSVIDSRLKLPVGFDPSGQTIVGVVTYSDPVADYDASQKVIALPFTF
jgi:uncharacterized repeat protein (TIGR03803 family)